MCSQTIKNVNGSIAKTEVAVESKPQQTKFEAAEVKGYSVPLKLDIELELVGFVEVSAVSESEAVAKLLRQIASGRVDYRTEMLDCSTCYGLTLDEVVNLMPDPVHIGIDESSVTTDDFDDIDPDELVEAQTNDLVESDIVWTTDALFEPERQ